MKAILHPLVALAMLALPEAALWAQDADEAPLDTLDAAPKPPPPQVQPPGAIELQDAVRRIAIRPTDSNALTDAGYAAVKLGDYDAAFNFFTKAGALQPLNARIKAGLAIAQVRRENPFEALSLFDEAIRLGANERSIALDRALAFDLLGNFERADRDYELAASFDSSDEVILRHAISLSLAGRRDEADRMLIPLLQKENPEAWRARAMMLASRGEYKEADKIALGFLSDAEARQMDGYFRNMPRLTGAQQAAAMHFGHFPLGSDIGEDSNTVRTMAAATGAKPAPATGDARLIPVGEPLGAKPAVANADKPKKSGKSGKENDKRSTGIRTASAQEAIDAAARAKVTTIVAARLPAPDAARPPVRIALPALAKPQPDNGISSSGLPVVAGGGELPATGPAVSPVGGVPPESIARPSPQPKTQPALPKPEAETRFTQIDPSDAVRSETAPQPGFETLPSTRVETVAATDTRDNGITVGPTPEGPPVGQVAMVKKELPSVPVPQPDPQPLPVAEKQFDLGALVASIEVPEDEKQPSTAPVDLKKIKPAAGKGEVIKPDAVAKPAKGVAVTPRIWVQVATGADATGLGYDYKRMAKKSPALFANREGWTSAWGKTKRLLVGPFADLKTAKKWEADFRKSGGTGFVWQSDKTAQIEKLKGK